MSQVDGAARGILRGRGITLVGEPRRKLGLGSRGDAMETGQSVSTHTEEFKIPLPIMPLCGVYAARSSLMIECQRFTMT